MPMMRPFVCTEFVPMPTIAPVKETALCPIEQNAIAKSAMETCSPVVNSMSISRA